MQTRSRSTFTTNSSCSKARTPHYPLPLVLILPLPDFVCNALDNVEARRYVDARCAVLERPLLESGTQGTKANLMARCPCSCGHWKSGSSCVAGVSAQADGNVWGFERPPGEDDRQVHHAQVHRLS
jgi:hypothetical protein